MIIIILLFGLAVLVAFLPRLIQKVYEAAIYGVIKFKGIDKNDADKYLYSLFNKPDLQMFQKYSFFVDVEDVIRKTIGNERYDSLLKYKKDKNIDTLIVSDKGEGMWYVAIFLFYNDEDERKIIGYKLEELVKKYLTGNNLSTRVLTKWDKNYTFNMPYFKIQYATNFFEEKNLQDALERECNAISARYTNVVDDTESVSLNA